MGSSRPSPAIVIVIDTSSAPAATSPHVTLAHRPPRVPRQAEAKGRSSWSKQLSPGKRENQPRLQPRLDPLKVPSAPKFYCTVPPASALNARKLRENFAPSAENTAPAAATAQHPINRGSIRASKQRPQRRKSVNFFQESDVQALPA